MQKFVVNFLKENKIALADFGVTIKDVAEENEIYLAAHCGGAGVCGACRVKILQGKVSHITQTERQFLTEQELKSGTRLACKTKILGNAVVETLLKEDEIKILDDILPFETARNALNASGFGVAIDLGTTSVVVAVFDMESGKMLGRNSFANPQASFGSDVMSRIASVSNNSANLQKMQQILVNSLKTSMSEILSSNNRVCKDIKKIAISGNTVMQHLFVGESPCSMGLAPYKPVFLCHNPIYTDEIGLPFTNARIYFAPNISAFVGGDITSGLTALDFDLKNEDETALFIDLGTNNEMALLANRRIFATSTAAGPAFEGAGISQGMRAAEGAICSVSFKNGEFISRTIADKKALGICGSGMIDCLAVFLENDIMERNGNLNDSNALVSRNEEGVLQVVLTEEEKICITQKDIRALQLVIASIKAGIKLLLKKADVNVQSLNKIYLAGAFGNFIDIEKAKKIGLLPNCNAKVINAKNTSLLGAIRSLFEDDFLTRAANVVQNATALNLAEEANFQANFINSLDF